MVNVGILNVDIIYNVKYAIGGLFDIMILIFNLALHF